MGNILKLASFLLCSLIMFGKADDDQQDILKEISRMMDETANDLLHMKEEIAATKRELADTKADNDAKDAIIDKLNRDVSYLKDIPYMYMCGFQTQVQQTETQTINYNQLFFSSTNTEDGGLDIATGVFTAPTPGTYTVTWSLTANAYQGFPWIDVFLRHNGEKIVHHYHTEFGADDLGRIFIQKDM